MKQENKPNPPEPPPPPLGRFINEAVRHNCANCGSSIAKSGFLRLFGEYLCYNEECPNSKSRIRKGMPLYDTPKPRPIKNKGPFTDDEDSTINLLLEAHNRFIRMEQTHPSDLGTWIEAFHRLQTVLMERVVRRDYPETFYSKEPRHD